MILNKLRNCVVVVVDNTFEGGNSYRPPFLREVKILGGCCKCCLNHVHSIQFCLSCLFFTAMVVFGSSVILIYWGFSTAGINSIFENNQGKARVPMRISLTILGILLDYAGLYYRSWMEQGPRILMSANDWLVFQSNSGNIDFDFSYNETSLPEEVKSIGRFFYSLTKSSYNLGSVSYASIEGIEIGVEVEGGIFFTTTENYTNSSFLGLPGPLLYRSMEGELIFREEVTTIKEHYDPRLTYWYKDVIGFWNENNTEVHWSHSVSAKKEFLVSASKLFYDQRGLRGVLSVFLRTDNIVSVLRELDIGTGILYFVEAASGKLIGTSEGHHMYNVKDGKPQLTDAVECHTIEVRTSSRALLGEYEEYLNIKETSDDLLFFIQGELWHMTVKPMDITGNLKVIAVFITRDWDIFKQIYIATDVTVAISIVFIVSIVALSSCVIFVVLSPLSFLSAQMMKIEKMKLHQVKIRPCCFFREIRMLQNRFKFLVERLKEYKAFLPDYIMKNNSNSLSKESIPPSSSRRIFPIGDERGGVLFPNSIGFDGSDVVVDNNDSPSTSDERKGLRIQVKRKLWLCVYLYIVNFEEIFQKRPSKYLKYYGELLTEITNLVQERAVVLDFKLDRIVICYKRKYLQRSIKDIVSIAELIPFRSSHWKFRVVAGMAMGRSISGVIGTLKSRSHVVQCGVVEKARFVIDDFVSSYLSQKKNKNNKTFPRVTVLMDGNVEKLSRSNPKFLEKVKPMTILLYFKGQHPLILFDNKDSIEKKVDSSFILTVYRYYTSSTETFVGGTEWNYRMEEMNKEVSFMNLRQGFNLMMKDKLDGARTFLLQSLNVEEGGFWKKKDDGGEEERYNFTIDALKLLKVIDNLESNNSSSFSDYLLKNAESVVSISEIGWSKSLVYSLEEKRRQMEMFEKRSSKEEKSRGIIIVEEELL